MVEFLVPDFPIPPPFHGEEEEAEAEAEAEHERKGRAWC